jgi:hypothetical protein
MGEKLSSLVLPGMIAAAWVLALLGIQAPGGNGSGFSEINTLKWVLYFAGWVFLFSSVMHSVFAKKMAKSIGWKTNGFQYEIAAVSLGLGLGCFYAVYRGEEAWVAISLPIITFLLLAGLNHLKEILKDKNFAPNNTLILIWDFGVPISLIALLYTIVR